MHLFIEGICLKVLIFFFKSLRKLGIPVSINELIDLIGALDKGLSFCNIDEFYFLSRSILVKDEKYFDRYDQCFHNFFSHIESQDNFFKALIPEDWLYEKFVKSFSDEDKKNIKSLGDFEKIIEEFKKRLEEQKKRHEGGNKWIGTGGTSPFGHGGYNPEGIRIGGESQNQRAVKVWEKRVFKDLDHDISLGIRNIKIAMKRLRRFARQGTSLELDLDDTITSTAKNAGYLDIKMVPEKKNIINLLLFFDVGGSMNPYVNLCEELFSAAKSEFKHLKYFYFHNFIYESVWCDNLRREKERISLYEILNTYSQDYKVIFVSDASMSPYEIVNKGGSIEHWNEESGEFWMKKLLNHFNKVVWLNPMESNHWNWTPSVKIIEKIVQDKMFTLSVSGIENAMTELSK